LLYPHDDDDDDAGGGGGGSAADDVDMLVVVTIRSRRLPRAGGLRSDTQQAQGLA
jgi:hypothetical protein